MICVKYSISWDAYGNLHGFYFYYCLVLVTASGVGAAPVGWKGQGLQSCMRCKCNAKPKLHKVQLWLVIIV